MQTRFWNFEDNDSTFLLNQRLVGIIDAGVYRGYDPAPFQADRTLRLFHNITGADQVWLDLITAKVGVLVTRQGVIIKEDTVIELPIELGSSLPRKDLIVCEHSYLEETGGRQALYSVIRGTPAENPIEPNFTKSTQQIRLGSILVPAGMQILTDEGVVYDKEIMPNFASNGKLDEAIAQLVHDYESQITTLQIGLERAKNDFLASVNLLRLYVVETDDSITRYIDNIQTSLTNSIAGVSTRVSIEVGDLRTKINTHEDSDDHDDRYQLRHSVANQLYTAHTLPSNTYVVMTGARGNYYGKTITLNKGVHIIYIENYPNVNVLSMAGYAFITKISPPSDVYDGYDLTVICTGNNKGTANSYRPYAGYEFYAPQDGFNDPTNWNRAMDVNLLLDSNKHHAMGTQGFAVSGSYALSPICHFAYDQRVVLQLRWAKAIGKWVEVGRSTRNS
jgi:hypothetical protein